MRQLRDGVHAGDFHGLGNAGSTYIQRASEDVGKTKCVIDLIRVIRTPGRDNAVWARAFGIFWRNFRIRVG